MAKVAATRLLILGFFLKKDEKTCDLSDLVPYYIRKLFRNLISHNYHVFDGRKYSLVLCHVIIICSGYQTLNLLAAAWYDSVYSWRFSYNLLLFFFNQKQIEILQIVYFKLVLCQTCFCF